MYMYMQRVVVNLCLASVEADLLGVNQHMCEVQLTTAAFIRAQARRTSHDLFLHLKDCISVYTRLCLQLATASFSEPKKGGVSVLASCSLERCCASSIAVLAWH